MKKLVVLTIGAVVFSLGGTASAVGSPTANTQSSSAYAISVVDGVAIPLDVIVYVQTEYQGHSVIQAAKMTRGGEQVYRLRVDRDDIPTDYDSFYLFYDMNWKLLGQEKITPPPKPVAAKPKPQPEKKITEKPRADDRSERKDQKDDKKEDRGQEVQTQDSRQDDESIENDRQPEDNSSDGDAENN